MKNHELNLFAAGFFTYGFLIGVIPLPTSLLLIIPAILLGLWGANLEMRIGNNQTPSYIPMKEHKEEMHKCASCGKESDSLTMKQAIAYNAVTGRCFECVTKGHNQPSPTPPAEEKWEEEYWKKVNEVRRDLGATIEGKENIYEFGYKAERGDELFQIADYENIRKFISRTLSSAKEEERKKTIEECIKLSDDIELREPDGGTSQWKAFKCFRNTMRDLLSLINDNKI